ncbi:c-type cytochrome domain-containing protein [Danxiaibacter flavus]|uniref:C-type cytochrome domain-containing protein n=1 Tax=Danxiaibacter flavus TaxID=3049108 RepID=A0ABV3ZK75_9BACT|nr:c-type cytochrome domain-containing protein [Chitinophagaceae bacterium DXS]
MLEFLGRFHPVLVHLPIGILLIALLMQYLSTKEKYAGLSEAVTISLLIGMLSAFASCITGYLLSLSGEYDRSAISWHMWMGFGVAIVSALLYVRRINNRRDKIYKIMSGALVLLIIITGHLGGNLTHGADYLTSALEGKADAKFKRKPIPDVQQAMAYNDLVQPILAEKCFSCHGPTKQKGKLRMDQQELLMKGGKDGVVIKPGNTDESEIIKRVLLPREDEHHMSPKEKPQLTQKEITVIKWWIGNGAPFDKKVNQLPQADSIKPVLLSFQNAEGGSSEEGSATIADKDIPAEQVTKADEKTIDALRKAGAIVIPVAQNSNYLQVNFLNDTVITPEKLQLIVQLKKQLVSLKLSNTNTNDAALDAIAQCTSLIKLFLDHTLITDKDLSKLNNLSKLRYLNLVGTAVTANGIKPLAQLKQLKRIYLYQTKVDKTLWAELQKQFPSAKLDSGGYIVPSFPSDTSLVQRPIVQ